ncbi:hypothetical protein [Leucobacter luti]|uniref:Uncharacterized protein n=1 Tax=Leucobacter luti TaxID=340320 RepID=A0A4Q7U1I2_9MICO|nr:hypothetical protein [Leucobacter luti]MBL3699007.1 hypothetical protein [Leucobacter luti]RZT66388.1 hypothetical protein EV139_1825 [Leucobacter luti]
MAKQMSTKLLNARAAAEKAKRELAAIEREEREAEQAEKRAAKAQESRSGLAEELYALLGIEPEPPREQIRRVKKDGARVEQTVMVDRDPNEKMRAKWALEAVQLMAKNVGEDNMRLVREHIEGKRQSARDADDAARAAKTRVATPVAAPTYGGGADPRYEE